MSLSLDTTVGLLFKHYCMSGALRGNGGEISGRILRGMVERQPFLCDNRRI